VREVDVADVDPAEFRVAQAGVSEAGDDRAPRADSLARMLLRVLDRRGLGHAQAPTDLPSTPRFSRSAHAAAPRSRTFGVIVWSISWRRRLLLARVTPVAARRRSSAGAAGDTGPLGLRARGDDG
jgi:hypothetical protein